MEKRIEDPYVGECIFKAKIYRLIPDDVLEELARRFGVSGHDEKAART